MNSVGMDTIGDALSVINAADTLDNLNEGYFPENGKLPSTKAALDKAAKHGLEVVYPEPNELFLDIDSPSNFDTFQSQRKILEQYAPFVKVVETASKTKGHKHIKIILPLTMTPIQRILLQAVLGSDLKRELLGFLMTLNNEEKPTLFLEPKAK